MMRSDRERRQEFAMATLSPSKKKAPAEAGDEDTTNTRKSRGGGKDLTRLGYLPAWMMPSFPFQKSVTYKKKIARIA